MPRTLGVALMLLWMLFVAAGHTFGGFVHGLLIAAILLFVLALIQITRVA